jgi:hypothetical protein
VAQIVPNHVCVVFRIVDRLIATRAGEIELAREKVM